MMKWIALTVTLFVLMVRMDAAEVIPALSIGRKTYHDVRWGSVNQGKVVMFHSRGIAIIPLSELPEEYQAIFGYQPPPTPTVVTPQATTQTPIPSTHEPSKITILPPLPEPPPHDPDWEAYNRDRKTKLVLRNRLVNRSELSILVGFVGNPVRIFNGSTKIRGFTLELAERKDAATQQANELFLRPNLWQRTGKTVLLRNYKSQDEEGILVRVYVVPAEDVDEHKSYEVATDPTFEQWKKLRYATVRAP